MKTLLLASVVGGTLVVAPPSAKEMFYDPASADPRYATAPAAEGTGLTPVGVHGIQFVGVHYWFENAEGAKFAEPSLASAGTRLTLKLRANVGASMTVWMSDAEHDSIELTPRTFSATEPGHRLLRDSVFAVPRSFLVVSPGERPDRIIIFLGRSHTEQVDSMSGAREKLGWIRARQVAGGSPLIREVDRSTRGQIGTYVVCRTGDQTGEEIVMASSAKR